MNPGVTNKSFIFNEKINVQCINDLYGNDYIYLQEVFGTVLGEYGTLIENIFEQYASHNIPGLKAAVHKMKPIFGFVGLLSMQHQCQQFEDNCQPSSPFDMLVNNYNALRHNLIASKLLIEEEKRKLELFNSQ